MIRRVFCEKHKIDIESMMVGERGGLSYLGIHGFSRTGFVAVTYHK